MKVKIKIKIKNCQGKLNFITLYIYFFLNIFQFPEIFLHKISFQ